MTETKRKKERERERERERKNVADGTIKMNNDANLA